MAQKRNRSTPRGVSVSSSPDAEPTKAQARRAEKVAAMRREQEQRQRRTRLLTAGGIGLAIVIVAAAVVLIGLNHHSKGAKDTAADTSVIQDVTTVPASVSNAAGAGGVTNPPKGVSGGSALTQGGLPRVAYIGAEYCPFCAVERWSLVAALSRFGTFSNLGQTRSAATDGNLNTLSFHGASYTSKYLAFTPYEIADTSGQPLEKAPADIEAIGQKLYGSNFGIPFIDIGGTYASDGASDGGLYGGPQDPGPLSGLSHAEIAQAMQDPKSDLGQRLNGVANVLTAGICQVTGGQPGSVCDASGVKTAAGQLSGS